MNNKLVQQGYDKAAINYLQGRENFRSQPYLEKFEKILKTGSHILDVGCGAGFPVDTFFIQHGHSVRGIDISSKQIELAKQRVPEAQYEQKDMTELKSGEYKSDAIVSFYAIFHIDRKLHLSLFQKFATFLPSGGVLLVTMGSDEWEGSEDNFFGSKMYWSQYGTKKNEELIQKAGFEIFLSEIDNTGGEKHQIIFARKK